MSTFLFPQVTAEQVSKMLHAIGFKVERLNKHNHYLYFRNYYAAAPDDASAWDKLVELGLATYNDSSLSAHKVYHVSADGIRFLTYLININIYDEETYTKPQDQEEEEGEQIDIEELTIRGLQVELHPKLTITEVKVSDEYMIDEYACLELKGQFFGVDSSITVGTELLCDGEVSLKEIIVVEVEDCILTHPLWELIEDNDTVNEKLVDLCRESVVKLGFNEDGSQID